MSGAVTQNIDALIVTALQLERLAVRSHLVNLTTVREDGILADLGRFAAGPANLTVIVIETGAGNIDAALAVQKAESTWRPNQVIMTGVAGGLKDVAVGDVVASSKVYWIEGGKETPEMRPRPDQAPVSPGLVQLARTVAADGRWLARAETIGGGKWPYIERHPVALVGPVAVGERVLGDLSGHTAELIRDSYGDALAINMEDFGVLRAVAAGEHAQALTVRGVSDLLRDKAHTDAAGAQPLAAANAAAFVFELLALNVRLSAIGSSIKTADLVNFAIELYPQGPLQDAVWERAGGDISRLELSGNGRTMWWQALRLMERGGGTLSPQDLLRTFAEDYPRHPALSNRLRATSH